jgi:hypothetical protein
MLGTPFMKSKGKIPTSNPMKAEKNSGRVAWSAPPMQETTPATIRNPTMIRRISPTYLMTTNGRIINTKIEIPID